MSRSSHVTVQVLERLGPNDLIDPAAWAPATTAAATLYPGERIVQPQRLDYTDYTLLCILHTLSLAFESLGQCRAEVSHVPYAPLSLLLNPSISHPKACFVSSIGRNTSAAGNHQALRAIPTRGRFYCKGSRECPRRPCKATWSRSHHERHAGEQRQRARVT